ncbi:MAG: DUF4345 domain-containing protein [Limimaricola sp.]|uniref:DUF4345 family protein n=1 Tax=Limimaricola sp. TaxID=2211665 RepID=UPI001DC675B6|nr:DUF4345 family protein [Limimaricola sp.]MBI1416871.1 DUF4345 domain-containing protein [Limimaricola sp.]
MDLSLLNPVLAAISVALGLFGWLAPAYTMQVVDLRPGASPMGASEVRAASGALFVGMGLGALWLNIPAAYAMLGFCWAGAAAGRATSLALDGVTQKKWVFFGTEAAVALIALALNLGH